MPNLPKQQVIDNVYLKDVDISYVLLIYTYRKKARNFGVSVLNVKFDSKFKRDAGLQFVPLVAKNEKKRLIGGFVDCIEWRME